MRKLSLHAVLAIVFTAAGICTMLLPAFAANDPAIAPADARTPAGRWLTESGNLEIEIAPCGQQLCGTVVRVISNRSMSAASKAPADGVDAMGSAPPAAGGSTSGVMGAKILHSLSGSDTNEWKGKIYNREDGKTYDCVVTYKAPDQLDVRGYKFLPLFGKTQVWRRVQ